LSTFSTLKSHCPWIGNCIGQRNHLSFFIFLISISIFTIVVSVSCLRVLGESYHECLVEEENKRIEKEQQYNVDDQFWNPYYDTNPNVDSTEYTSSTTDHSDTTKPFQYHIAFRTISNLPIEVAFGLFSLLCAWSLTSLTCFHGLIITLAQTTNERVRGVYQYGGIGNPADEGCIKNWMSVLCPCCSNGRRKEIMKSRIPNDFSAEVTLPGRSVSSSGEGKDSTTSQTFLEETVWPGWNYALLYAPPTTSPTAAAGTSQS